MNRMTNLFKYRKHFIFKSIENRHYSKNTIISSHRPIGQHHFFCSKCPIHVKNAIPFALTGQQHSLGLIPWLYFATAKYDEYQIANQIETGCDEEYHLPVAHFIL